LTRLPSAAKRAKYIEVDDETAAIVKALASRLRTSTTEDVATRVRSRVGPSDFVRRWRGVRRPVRLSVDRRWEWAREGVSPCYFVLIENRSPREIVISKLSLDGVDTIASEPPLPLLVQAHEPREVAVRPIAEKIVVGQVPRVEVTLSSGRRIGAQTPPEIPIATDALGLPTEHSRTSSG
jgi:hypothetical protein